MTYLFFPHAMSVCQNKGHTSLICSSFPLNQRNYGDRRCPGTGTRVGWVPLFMAVEFQFGRMKEVQEMAVGDGLSGR